MKHEDLETREQLLFACKLTVEHSMACSPRVDEAMNTRNLKDAPAILHGVHPTSTFRNNVVLTSCLLCD